MASEHSTVRVAPAAALEELPELGFGVLRSFTNETTPQRTCAREEKTLRICSWNIERGVEIDLAAEALRELNADILLLSEVDVQTGRCSTVKCSRAHIETHPERKTLDCGQRIAEALGYHCLLVTEMMLVHGGVMCNAILSRFPMREPRALRHDSQFFTYTKETTSVAGAGKWPRKGARTAAVAICETGNIAGDVIVYSDHFEMRCGPGGRIAQLNDLLHDYEAQSKRMPAIIGGDLNTFFGGVVKLLPKLAVDGTGKPDPVAKALVRFGMSEAELWQSAILGDAPGRDAWDKKVKKTASGQLAAEQTHEAARDAQELDWKPRASASLFVDPFHPKRDWTVRKNILGFVPVYHEKIDWILCSRDSLEVQDKGRGNLDHKKSDHAFIWVDMTLKKEEAQENAV